MDPKCGSRSPHLVCRALTDASFPPEFNLRHYLVSRALREYRSRAS